MKKQYTKYITLLILAAIFAAPGIIAYLFYQHPSWLGSSKVNKGILLSPPIAMKPFDNHVKWRIIYWSPEGCDKTCLKQLNLLGRIRLALGRKLYQVDEWLILSNKDSSVAEELKPILKEQDIHVAALPLIEMAKLTNLSSDAKIFVANPDNYLILSYQPGGNPDNIYKDLKLLLNTTEIKSG
ncbi:hypothetical protein EP47_12920 [Legionella norrlandica]|uniref:Cytochrome oxidase assembly protein n=1 Tax=Legionella norrlandica TaxID=1498499 RepID=A0A0A2T6H1_9GAMM|nr:hypothetical protein [Legionella norrlandica]KGP63023.1 hypothetical protein EP47_12920 [Legionella norrlandica]